MKSLIDPFGRKIRKLRISLTDKCNLRCHYCMPINSQFMSEEKYISPDLYHQIVEELCEYGLEELRITGGEPLLRKSFENIVSGFKGLGLAKIGMTTNGILLDRYADILKENNINHLNISLDSLDQENFKKITNGNRLAVVLKNIQLVKKMGFDVKINTVAMRGINDHELFNFIDYSKEMDIEVRFLEIMRIGFANGEQNNQFISANEMIKEIQNKFELFPVKKESDSTSFNFQLNNGAQIGFIASESQPFCTNCSRWRLSADGKLRACLLKDAGLSIKNTDKKRREEIYLELLGMKPEMRPYQVDHQMNEIGG